MKRILLLATIFLSALTIDAQPPKKAVEAYNQAMQLVSQTKFVDAMSYFQKATELYPNYYQAYLDAAKTFAKLNLVADAIFCFNKTIKIKPDYCPGYLAFGTFYKEARNRSDSALMYYEKAIKLNCTLTDTMNFNIGWCYNDKGKYEKAIERLKKAIEQNNNYKSAITEISFSYRKMDKMQEGVDYFQQLYNTTKNGIAMYYIGFLYVAMNQKDKAQAAADELKKTNVKLAEAVQKRIDAMKP